MCAAVALRHCESTESFQDCEADEPNHHAPKKVLSKVVTHQNCRIRHGIPEMEKYEM